MSLTSTTSWDRSSFFFFQAEDGIRYHCVTGVQTCALPICPQLQERLTAQVADALHGSLGAQGAIVVVEADHLCMTVRGVQKPGSVTVTSAVRGIYAKDQRTRQEAMSLITGHRW